MATQNITFADKTTGSILLATDVNSIKLVVNNNSTELSTLQTTVANIDISGISTNATAIGTLQTNVGTLQTTVNNFATEFETATLSASDIEYPTADGERGDVIMTDGAGDLTFGAPERVEIHVANDTAGSLAAGTPVYSLGEKGNSGIIRVAAAQANDGTKLPAIGVLKTDLGIDQEGLAIITGIYNPAGGITITGAVAGDTVYVSDSGDLTITKPTGNSQIQNMGQVLRTNAVGDVRGLKISSIDRTNDIPNLGDGEIFIGNSTDNHTVSAFDDVLELTDLYTTVQNNSATNWSSYSDTDVATYLNGNLGTNIIPAVNSTYDIGSAEKKIRHLYLSQNSLKFVNNDDPENIIEYSLGAPGGVLTFDGEAVGGGGSSFSLNTINEAGEVKQLASHTHTLYDATAGDIVVDLLDASVHAGVTQHKRVDGSTNTVTLSSSTGATIDGATEYALDTQYEAVGLYTDGTDYYIQ